MKEAHDHHRVSPEGKAMGKTMADLVAPIIAQLAADGEPGECCKTCAFRLGTVPNGCMQTQSDVAKAVFEGVPFMCHQSADFISVCHGWFAARQHPHLKGKHIPVPWEMSPPDEDFEVVTKAEEKRERRAAKRIQIAEKLKGRA